MYTSDYHLKRFVAKTHNLTSALFTLTFTMMYDIKQHESYSSKPCLLWQPHAVIQSKLRYGGLWMLYVYYVIMWIVLSLCQSFLLNARQGMH